MTIAPVSDSRVLAQLKETFGFEALRPLQDEVVRSVLDRRDTFVLMPTGAGKSLCYQLPALLRPGLTVVVSPLIALMKDQVDRLRAMGVAASFINSSLDQSEIGRRQGEVARGEVKLLYVAPERLMMPGFLHLLASREIELFAIDEAHCISEWGHDFRPEYRQLRQLRDHFPSTPIAAFTATATRRVQADILAQLSLKDPAVFRGSLDRPNLFYRVWPKQGAYRQLTDYLRARGPVAGIVYAQSRAQTERLAAKLQSDGFSAAAYHAGLENDERRDRQEAFLEGEVRIMVATIAFGMGIDKPDIRFVAHFDLPKNIEGYYQETGRAGRDGEPSDCILFYSYGDAFKHDHFIQEKTLESERRAAKEQLARMVAWAESTICRRQALLAYFDEETEPRSGLCCDVCEAPADEADWTVPAQMLLSCAKRTGETYGVGYLIQVLRGSKEARIMATGHDKLSTYGIGKDRSRQEWHRLANELLRTGYIHAAPDRFNAVEVTALGREVLFQGRKVVLRMAEEEPVATTAAGDPLAHPDLFEELRALRRKLAQERQMAPFTVFHDTTLRQMAAELPATPERLLRITGVGTRKLEDFGETFLAAIRSYVQRTGAQSTVFHSVHRSTPPPSAARDGALSTTVTETLEMFRRGVDVPEIARARMLAPSTVERHLAEALESGEQLDLDRLVPLARRRAIEAVLDRLGPSPLKPVMEALGDGYTYAEIRYTRTARGLGQDPAPQH